MIKQRDMEKYTECMEEVKLRQQAIKDMMTSQTYTTYFITNVEFICLQFRKILELIAMATLTSNKYHYKEIWKRFYNHYKAREIFKEIEKFNPDFYPVPTRQVIENGIVKETVRIDNGYLTKDDFDDVYGKCSSVIHSTNPYNNIPVDIVKISEEFVEWNTKITRLLNHHQVQLYDKDYQLWVLMNSEGNGKVQVNLFKKIS